MAASKSTGGGGRPRPGVRSATRRGAPSRGAVVERPGGRLADTARIEGTRVSDVQCARMVEAAMEVVGELGYGGMSVARITGRAGVSRRTFYDLFEDREDCFLAVFEESVSRARAAVVAAVVGERSWRARLRTGLAALLALLDDRPLLGSLVVVDALGAGPRVLAARTRVLAELIAIVDEGRGEARRGHLPPPLTAEGVVGAVFSVVHARMLERGGRPLIELLNPLMGMIVLPYMGQHAGARELAGVVPKARPVPPRPTRDPLADLDMRLTYRTLRVLAAVASHPDASNRVIADAAGVQDQGQISKLLTRLESLGLLTNRGRGQARGEPNAWTLTAKGQDVEHTVGSRTEGGR